MVGEGGYYTMSNYIKLFHQALGLNTALKTVTIENFYLFM